MGKERGGRGSKREKQIHPVTWKTLKGGPGESKEEVSTKHLKITGL